MFFKCQRREGWFFWHPPACFSIFGNVYPPHWSIGREGGDSGFRRSRIWILVSRNKVAPLPLSCPAPSIPLPLVLEVEERMSQFCSPQASGPPPGCVLFWDWGPVRGSEGEQKAAACGAWPPRVSTSLLPESMAFLPVTQASLAWWWEILLGMLAVLIWGVDSCFPRRVLLTVGLRKGICLRKNSICI